MSALVRLPAAVFFATAGLGAALVLAACSGSPSSVTGAPTTAPDDQYETDNTHSYRVLVWTCTPRYERVVIYQRCAEGCTGCGGWKLEHTRCPGGPTALETSIAGLGRHPIPAGYGWP